MNNITQSLTPVNSLHSTFNCEASLSEGMSARGVSRSYGAGSPWLTSTQKGFKISPLVMQWSQFLSNYDWNWWATFTFREPKHPEAAAKLYDHLIHVLSKEIYGNRYYKKKGVGVIWARATENQEQRARFYKKDVIHYHAVLGNIPETVRRLDYMDYWDKIAGHARIFAFEKGVGAEAYLSKSCYAWKRGEIDLGGPLAVPVNGSAVLFG